MRVFIARGRWPNATLTLTQAKARTRARLRRERLGKTEEKNADHIKTRKKMSGMIGGFENVAKCTGVLHQGEVIPDTPSMYSCENNHKYLPRRRYLALLTTR